jgi:predicted nucleic acid-binding protein
MIVISNASSLVALSRIYRLDLFHQLFGTLLIPPAVESEVVTYCPDARQKRHLETALDTFFSHGSLSINSYFHDTSVQENEECSI